MANAYLQYNSSNSQNTTLSSEVPGNESRNWDKWLGLLKASPEDVQKKKCPAKADKEFIFGTGYGFVKADGYFGGYGPGTP